MIRKQKRWGYVGILMLGLAACAGGSRDGTPSVAPNSTPVVISESQVFQGGSEAQSSGHHMEWLPTDPSVTTLNLGDALQERRLSPGDALPSKVTIPSSTLHEVPVTAALQAVLAGTNISLTWNGSTGDHPVTVDNLSGPLPGVVDKICATAEIFCSYRRGSLELQLEEPFVVKLPLQDKKNQIAAVLGEGLLSVLSHDDPNKIQVDPQGESLIYAADVNSQNKVHAYLEQLRNGRPLIAMQLYVWDVVLDESNRGGIAWSTLHGKSQIPKNAKVSTSSHFDVQDSTDSGVSLNAIALDHVNATELAEFLATQGRLKASGNAQVVFASSTAQVAATGQDKEATASDYGTEVFSRGPGIDIGIKGGYDKGLVTSALHVALKSDHPTALQAADLNIDTIIHMRPGDDIVLAGVVTPLTGAHQKNDKPHEIVLVAKPTVYLFANIPVTKTSPNLTAAAPVPHEGNAPIAPTVVAPLAAPASRTASIPSTAPSLTVPVRAPPPMSASDAAWPEPVVIDKDGTRPLMALPDIAPPPALPVSTIDPSIPASVIYNSTNAAVLENSPMPDLGGRIMKLHKSLCLFLVCSLFVLSLSHVEARDAAFMNPVSPPAPITSTPPPAVTPLVAPTPMPAPIVPPVSEPPAPVVQNPAPSIEKVIPPEPAPPSAVAAKPAPPPEPAAPLPSIAPPPLAEKPPVAEIKPIQATQSPPTQNSAVSEIHVVIDSKPDLDVGDTPINATKHVVLSFVNHGNVAVPVDKIALKPRGHIGFVITQDTCSKQTLVLSGECNVGLDLSPHSDGVWSLDVELSPFASSPAARTHITGQALVAGAAAIVKPSEKKESEAILSLKGSTSIDFDNVKIGAGKNVRSVLMVNEGKDPLTLQSLEVVADKSLVRVPKGCLPNMRLKAGQSCPVLLSWTPTKAGPLSTDLIIRYTGGSGFIVIPVRGSAEEKVLVPSPPKDIENQQTVSTVPPVPAPPTIVAAQKTPKAVSPKNHALSVVTPDLQKLVSAMPATSLNASAKKHEINILSGLRLTGTVGNRAIIQKPSGVTVVVNIGDAVDLGEKQIKILDVRPQAADILLDNQTITLTIEPAGPVGRKASELIQGVPSSSETDNSQSFLPFPASMLMPLPSGAASR